MLCNLHKKSFNRTESGKARITLGAKVSQRLKGLGLSVAGRCSFDRLAGVETQPKMETWEVFVWCGGWPTLPPQITRSRGEIFPEMH